MIRKIRVLSRFQPHNLRRVVEAVPEVELIHIAGQGDLPTDVWGEVFLTPPWGTPNMHAVIERGVRWIHTIGTGVDRFPFELVGDRLLTCARGASAIPIAEWVLAVMLAFEKRLPEAWVAEAPEHWSHLELGGLCGKTLGIVGLGGIGTA